MHLDDSKYKVYIYNMEDELSSESEAEDNGKLVFLPDIEKHLRKNRILPSYIMNNNLNAGPSPDPELAQQMQLVLYNIPSSITVPEEQDSVRKAIIEERARMRERQKFQQEKQESAVVSPVQSLPHPPLTNGFQTVCAPSFVDQPRQQQQEGDDDPDAMELD